MDCRTGRLITREELEALEPDERRHFREVAPTAAQMRRRKIGRNERCPCGSGRKFKRCCMTPLTRPSTPTIVESACNITRARMIQDLEATRERLTSSNGSPIQ